MITFESLTQGLGLFYLTMAILALTIALVVYPTLSKRSKPSKRK